MKTILFILLLIIPPSLQAQVTDNFSDGNFTANPPWVGDGSQFTVNGSQQLQLNSSGSGVSYLSLATNLTSLDNTEWRFWIHLNFSPSDNNHARVYLASDQQNLEGSLNGYYLQFGENLSNDAVELFRQDGAVKTSVCRGTNALIAAAFTIGVKVERNSSGLWSLSVDAAGGTNYTLQATGTDATYQQSDYFGILCTYTTSNATNFFFDDFSVPFMADVSAPQVQLASATSDSLLDVYFDEAVELVSAQTPANYSVNNGIGAPLTATRDAADFSLVHLRFAGHFAEAVEHEVSVTNVKDLSNNSMTSASHAHFTWFNPQPVASGDIVINEVLFSVNTGGAEFVEIYNRSAKAIDLKELRFTRIDLATGIADPAVSLISTTLLLPPGGFMVLTDNPGAVKSQYYTENPNAFLSMNLPDLLTEEDILVLQDSVSQTIDQLHYYSSWHFPLLNDVHGVSLERLNAARPTDDATNWHSASQNAGFATPGYKNSQHTNANSGGGQVSIVPEVFSPDNDGVNDVVNVKFHLDNPGYVANVKVFDSKGRTIRTLIENELLGNESVFSWDGTSDEKEKARTGVYVFFIEVFNTDGDVKQFKKTCVLATRL